MNIKVKSYGEHCECPGSVCGMPSPRQPLSSETLAMAAVYSHPRPLMQCFSAELWSIEHRTFTVRSIVLYCSFNEVIDKALCTIYTIDTKAFFY